MPMQLCNKIHLKSLDTTPKRPGLNRIVDDCRTILGGKSRHADEIILYGYNVKRRVSNDGQWESRLRVDPNRLVVS